MRQTFGHWLREHNTDNLNTNALTTILSRVIQDTTALDETKDFHVVWNPIHHAGPHFAFASKLDADALADILRIRFAPSTFFVMSHYWVLDEAAEEGPVGHSE